MDNFKSDLQNTAMTDSGILNKYILCDNPYIFSNNVGLYSQLKTTIGSHFQVDITRIHMVGSAKLGFSIARSKLWKTFDDDSDIDMVIISEAVFDRLWKILSTLNVGHYDRTEQEQKKFDSFLKYFFRGWIRPDFLPLKHAEAQEWLDYFKSISYKRFGPYKITCAVFKEEFFFRKYHERNIHLIRQGVDHA